MEHPFLTKVGVHASTARGWAVTYFDNPWYENKSISFESFSRFNNNAIMFIKYPLFSFLLWTLFFKFDVTYLEPTSENDPYTCVCVSVYACLCVYTGQTSYDNSRLKNMKTELSSKHLQRELDGFGLYLWVLGGCHVLLLHAVRCLHAPFTSFYRCL